MGFINRLLRRDTKGDRRHLTKEFQKKQRRKDRAAVEAYSFRDLGNGADDDDHHQQNDSSMDAHHHTNTTDGTNGHHNSKLSKARNKSNEQLWFDHSFPILSNNANTEQDQFWSSDEAAHNTSMNSTSNSTSNGHNPLYPDSTDSELSDASSSSTSKRRPHLIGSILPNPDDGSGDNEDDGLYFTHSGGYLHSNSNNSNTNKSTSSNGHKPQMSSISLPDASSMIRHQYMTNHHSQSKKASSHQRSYTPDESLPSMIQTSTPGSTGFSSSRSCYSSSSNPHRHHKSSRRRRSYNHNNDNEFDDDHKNIYDDDNLEGDEDDNDAWLKQGITDVLGSQGVAADLDSLSGWSRKSGGGSVGGRSYNSRRSYRSNRSHRSRKSNRSKQQQQLYSSGYGYANGMTTSFPNDTGNTSVSGLSRGSKSASVAKDLMRLEQQLAKVAGNTNANAHSNSGNYQQKDGQKSVISGDDDSAAFSSSKRSYHSKYSIGTSQTKSRFTVTVPPGRLGVILANKRDGRGTVVSEVRLTSVLYGKLSPGDRILAVDGEDVSQFYLEEVTAIMSRKAGHERTLTIWKAQPINTAVVLPSSFPVEQDYFAADFAADFGDDH